MVVVGLFCCCSCPITPFLERFPKRMNDEEESMMKTTTASRQQRYNSLWVMNYVPGIHVGLWEVLLTASSWRCCNINLWLKEGEAVRQCHSKYEVIRRICDRMSRKENHRICQCCWHSRQKSWRKRRIKCLSSIVCVGAIITNPWSGYTKQYNGNNVHR